MKINEATGPALAWMVAKAAGANIFGIIDGYVYTGFASEDCLGFRPDDDWQDGGPIIEREGIRLHRSHTGEWWASPEADPYRPVSGPTALIAAMRCYAIYQLGDEFDVPEELS